MHYKNPIGKLFNETLTAVSSVKNMYLAEGKLRIIATSQKKRKINFIIHYLFQVPVGTIKVRQLRSVKN